MSRFFALFLGLALSLPHPAFALRPAGLEESSPETKNKFLTALGVSPTAAPLASSPAVGLEEGGIEAHWWAMRQQNKAGWFEYELPILSILAVVTEPVSVGQIKDYSGQDEQHIGGVLQRWDSYLEKAQTSAASVPLAGETRVDPGYRASDALVAFIQGKESDPAERINLRESHARIVRAALRKVLPRNAPVREVSPPESAGLEEGGTKRATELRQRAYTATEDQIITQSTDLLERELVPLVERRFDRAMSGMTAALGRGESARNAFQVPDFDAFAMVLPSGKIESIMDHYPTMFPGRGTVEFPLKVSAWDGGIDLKDVELRDGFGQYVYPDLVAAAMVRYNDRLHPPAQPAAGLEEGDAGDRFSLEAASALRGLELESAQAAGSAHVLFNEATIAALFFLHLPADAPLSPNAAVVDIGQGARLMSIAYDAGFSVKAVDDWADRYLVTYNSSITGDIQRATGKAEGMLAERLPGAEPIHISTLPDALNEFGARIKAILESFGLTFQSGTLTDGVIESLYKAAQA